MKFLTLGGRTVEVRVKRCLIHWMSESRSIFQTDVKEFLYAFWRNDVVCEEFPVAGSLMTLDLVNVSRRIAVEVQGRQHSSYVPFLAGSRSGYRRQIQRDMDKAKWCNLNGIKLVEIEPEDMPLTRDFFADRYDILL